MKSEYYRYYTCVVCSVESGLSWYDEGRNERYFIIEKKGNKFYCHSQQNTVCGRLVKPFKAEVSDHIYNFYNTALEEITEAEAFIEIL